MRLFVLNMLTTELRLNGNFFIDTKSHTYVSKFYVIFPKRIRVAIFIHCAVCQLVN